MPASEKELFLGLRKAPSPHMSPLDGGSGSELGHHAGRGQAATTEPGMRGLFAWAFTPSHKQGGTSLSNDSQVALWTTFYNAI